MKYLKILFVLLLTVMLIPQIVFAEGNSVSLSAPKTASKNDEVSVDIVLNTATAVNEFKSNLTYESTVLEILSIENKNGWKQENEFSKESPVTLDFSHENGLSGKTVVATIKFKVKGDVAKSSTTLTIEGSTKQKADETIDTLEKHTSKIDIKSTDNTLKDLKINGETIANFSPTTYQYSLQVDASVTTINIEATLNDKTATFKDKYGPRKGLSLDYGENVFEIIVLSGTKEEKKYVVNITRQDNRGTNNNLSDIIINSNSKILHFNENTLRYEIITHKLEKINITVMPQDPKATVKIDKLKAGETEGEIPIVTGANTIKIVVASEKKEEKTYTIVINNLDRDIDTRLKSLDDVIFGLDENINFNPDVYEYELTYKSKYKEGLTVKDKKMFEVMNSQDAEVTNVTGYQNLEPGGKITITVSPLDGTEGVDSVYTITFKKDSRINFFLILGIIIFIVLLVIFIRLLTKNKKNKQKIVEEDKNLEKTKRLEKINLE